jgi:hypothetical protein
MRKFTLLLMSLTIAVPLYAQKQTMAEATYALKGPIQEMRVESATIFNQDGKYVEGPRVLNMTATFDEKGRRPELYLYNEKGALTRRIVMRWEGDKEMGGLNYDGAGRMWLRSENIYGADGLKREGVTYNGEGSVLSRTILTRNEKGQVIQTAEYDAKGTLIDKFVTTYNDGGEVKTSERTFYNNKGVLVLKQFTDMAEKRSESLTYNPNGSLAGKTIRVNQEITELGPDGSLRKKTVISDVGRLPAESFYNPDGTIRKESQIPDEIDSYGNWTKQTKWITDSQGIRPVKVTYRKLTYYSRLRL